jgi:hypothetical protein
MDRSVWTKLYTSLFEKKIIQENLSIGTEGSSAFVGIPREPDFLDFLLDWRALGYSLHEPWFERSLSEQEKFKHSLIAETVEFTENQLVPLLAQFGTVLEPRETSRGSRLEMILAEQPVGIYVDVLRRKSLVPEENTSLSRFFADFPTFVCECLLDILKGNSLSDVRYACRLNDLVRISEQWEPGCLPGLQIAATATLAFEQRFLFLPQTAEPLLQASLVPSDKQWERVKSFMDFSYEEITVSFQRLSALWK